MIRKKLRPRRGNVETVGKRGKKIVRERQEKEWWNEEEKKMSSTKEKEERV